ncbi:MAG TPA: helix-turn-helix domain-containing protein [Cyclobacteriaceae bacterium]|nr:helix-turn-helix domain-containing protein [Cyclobacteriaceae bacterium]
MEDSTEPDDILIKKLTKQIDDNLVNDQFGVEDLSRNVGMSRSQLHRKLNLATGKSVSQFIREHRLKRGMELLKQGSLTAAEISERIGFGSPTYFNKCFNDFYGFPPGEVKNRLGEIEKKETIATVPKRNGPYIVAGVIVLVVLTIAYFIFFKGRNEITAQSHSIAILPFKNLSEDHQNQFFVEGVSEAIRTNLAQSTDLRVISSTSVEQFRQSTLSAREIARELSVSALLEGSVQRSENRVRIDVRLVDGVTQEQVWAKSYDHELKDVFAIQTAIAQQVAGELNAKLSARGAVSSRADTDNPKAYDLYLKGVYEYRTYTNQGAHNAIELFTQAIELDSNYARAYAFLANSYIGLATIFGAEQSAIEALEKGKPFIDKALELDPDLDEAQMLMGFYELYHDWDFEEAERWYEPSIKSNHPDALALYADYLNFVMKHEKAMEVAERLDELDPYYPNSRIVLSSIYNGRFEEALAFSESRLKMYNNYYTFDQHGFLLLNMKRYEEAIMYFQKAIALAGKRSPRMLGWTGAAYARSGDRKKALEIIDELKTRLGNKDGASIGFFIAVIYAALDEKRPAVEWLQTAYANHDMEMPWLMTEPQFYNLRSEPGFQELAGRLGFK